MRAAKGRGARLRANAQRPRRRGRLRNYRDYTLIGACALLSFGAVWVGTSDDPELARDDSGTRNPRSVAVGQPRAVDGDTLAFPNARIRLDGIDAPENDQRCRDRAGVVYACGRTASAALTMKMAGETVRCELHGTDRYNRQLAYCLIGDLDLGEWLVREGHAVAYWRYSWRYVPAEFDARLNRKGVWQGEFDRPEDWRRDHPRRNGNALAER